MLLLINISTETSAIFNYFITNQKNTTNELIPELNIPRIEESLLKTFATKLDIYFQPEDMDSRVNYNLKYQDRIYNNY